MIILQPSKPALYCRLLSAYIPSQTSATLDDKNALPDFYAVLAVSPSAPDAAIKHAYHHALLQHHPDKRRPHTSILHIDIGLLKQAYETLASPASRAAYDAARQQQTAAQQAGPRPAQVVSLEDWVEAEGDDGHTRWIYACRCGGQYLITVADMEAGQHLVGCNSCSEVVWAGYELAEDEDSSDV